MGLLQKAYKAFDSKLDSVIKSSQENEDHIQHLKNERKALVELETVANNNGGIYRERYSMAGPEVLKNMARRNSLIIAIHQSLINQVSNFTHPPEDKYSPGYLFKPRKPADLTPEEKLQLADPELSEEEFNKLKYEMDKKRSQRQKKQAEDIERGMKFIAYCGSKATDTDTTYKRVDFDRFTKIVARDRLTYNYAAIELIPTKGNSKVHHFYPVSSGTIRFVSARSANHYEKNIKPYIVDTLGGRYKEQSTTPENPFRYVQVLRGKPVAAFTEDELIFEAANPTVDPEDYGYGQGELEWLINIVTSHLYAEAHNRNFFTQGVGNKGILHIKGDNISRAQLEGFKRQWFNQLSNSRNAFRPPVIGMAEDVKWVALTQSNREMEFQQWMEYLIKIACAIYQIDPAEINFDISKTNTSTLQEANNEHKIKSSRTKGLKPLLTFLQGIINNQILVRWDKEFAENYEFRFVGLDAETRMQEIERLEKEGQVYKTVNEVRTEMGLAPIDHGDIILNANYTQYLAQQNLENQEEEAMMGEDNPEGVEAEEQAFDFSDVESELDDALSELDDEKPQEKPSEVKKSVTIENYYLED